MRRLEGEGEDGLEWNFMNLNIKIVFYGFDG
jgi:hypothetical protein